MKGAMAAMVASQVRRLSRLVRASLEAVRAARSSACALRGRPRPEVVCRLYSSVISTKTGTSGLGLNWSATAAISLSRVDLRNARMKRWLWVRARRKERPLGEHDHPGKDGTDEKDDKDGEGYGAAVVDHLQEGG